MPNDSLEKDEAKTKVLTKAYAPKEKIGVIATRLAGKTYKTKYESNRNS